MSESEKNVNNERTAPALPDLNGSVTQEVLCENGGSFADITMFPDFKLSGCFSSHMVIQRRAFAKVYGFSRHPGLKVKGIWTGAGISESETFVGNDGRFTLEFAPREAEKDPSCMIISSAYGSYVLSDILVGDVWMIGGQSNAECHLAQCMSAEPEILPEISADDNFRLFFQSQARAFDFREDCAYPRDEIIDPSWRWTRPGKYESLNFSAIGYYFAKELTRHTDVPLGMVMICAGGACLRELMPYGLSVERGYTLGANMPVGGYYNTLISPFARFPFYGQIFFQGESEGIWKEMAYSYDADLAALVEDERNTFKIDFPFYNVQLSSYREEGKQYFPHLHVVRIRQFDAVSEIKDSHLAVSMDLGSLPSDSDFAHSPHKAELGRRLALQAFAYEYDGEKAMEDPAEYESPAPVSVEKAEGGFMIKFKNTGKGLKTRPGNGSVPAGFGFVLKGEEEMRNAKAEFISPDTVFVSAFESDGEISHVCYAFFHLAYPENANVVNSFGLPLPAFRLSV